MTTATGGDVDYRVTFGRVVRSEWTKLHSLRSTWWVVGSVAAVSIGLAGLSGWSYERQLRSGELRASASNALEGTFVVLELLGLVVGVLGVIQMSGEYGSGSIRATLAAVPRRLPVLGAKALAFVGLMVPVMIVVCLASFRMCSAFASSDGTTVGDPGVFRSIIGAACYPVGLGLLGLALGTMIRHTAGAITAFVGALLIAPALMLMLPGSIQDAVSPYQPVLAGQAMFVLEPAEESIEMLTPGAGALVLAGWVVLLLGAAAFVLRRRDA